MFLRGCRLRLPHRSRGLREGRRVWVANRDSTWLLAGNWNAESAARAYSLENPAVSMLSGIVLQARTSTHSTRQVIRRFCRFASTTSPVCSTPATATNRMCILLRLVRRFTFAQVQRQRLPAFGKPLISKSEETLSLSRLTPALLRRLRESLYSSPVQSALQRYLL